MGARASRPLGRGFTLIELLIVITILIMVTVVSVPLLGPGTRGRQVREAAREFSAFVAGARAKALELGRPAGIWLERFPTPAAGATAADLKTLSDTGNFHFCVNAYLAVTPPPYSGDTLDSRVVVRDGAVVDFRPATGWMGLVRAGDLMKLNFQGRTYQISVLDRSKIDARGYLTAGSLPWKLTPLDSAMDPFVPNSPPNGVPFQILRQPVRSNEAPLQLPGSAVIDLDLSGLDGWPIGGEGGTFPAVANPTADPPVVDTNPVIITFGPSGGLDTIYYGFGQVIRPTEPVYLLVGRREKVLPAGDDPNTSQEPDIRWNYQDTSHWWVAVGHQTGRISVTELASPADVGALGSSALLKTRHFARLAQSTGGR